MATAQTWEYKLVNVMNLVGDARDDDSMAANIEAKLNGLGAQGWEVCENLNNGLILKRPK